MTEGITPQAPRAWKRASTAAALSLWLGLLGFITCGVASLLAVPFGIIALVQMERHPDEISGEREAVAGIVISTIYLLFLFTVAIPWWHASLGDYPGSPLRPSCKSNLHNISLGLHMYHSDNGAYPSTIEQLFGLNYLSSFIDDPFLDPSDEDPEVRRPSGLKVSYRYVGRLPHGIRPEVIICYCRQGIHEGGRNVLRMDGTVEWLTEEQLTTRPSWHYRQATLRDSYDYAVAAYGEELTPERDAELRAFYEIDGDL